MELPEPGRILSRDEIFGAVESVKAVSDIYSPVSGEILEINAELADHPEKLNSDPHGAAWLVKIRLTDPNQVQHLMNSADYQSYVGAEK